MKVDKYIGWPLNVNQVILETTNIKVGTNALKQTSLENGMKKSYARNSYVPDIYQVTMEFDWVKKDANGFNEYERFLRWYKYQHKYGSIPFEFPHILYSPETGIKVFDDNSNSHVVEYYKITSVVEGKKSGEKVSCTMTWESVFNGVITVPVADENIVSLKATKNYCDITFSALGTTTPVSANFKVYIDNTEKAKNGYYFSDYVARIYYADLDTGSHTVTFSYSSSSSSLVVNKNDFIYNVKIE